MTSENSYINRQIGNYHVISELASGAFGRVYLAQHMLLKKRTVAIKLLHATYLGSSEERESFLQEAQFLEQLKHPYILPIIDVSIEDGLPYLVAEYAPNGSLRNRIKSCSPYPLPLQEILTILIQIGKALQYAHQQQIIHRDLKPENILFNAKNEALLADFGLATSVTSASIKHIDNAGTPRYMAPEQFQGNVSKESDQYALACIAYELITGRQPFTDSDFFTLAFKHLAENPIPPTQLNPSLPIAAEQVILKAMAKQRADRYRDIASFITALVHSATSQPFSLTSSLTEIPTLAKTTFTGLEANIPTFIPANTYNSSGRITGPGTYDRSTVLNDRQYNTTPDRIKDGPITPIPPSYRANPITPLPLLDTASPSLPGKAKRGTAETSPAGALVNATQFSSPNNWPVSNTLQQRKPSFRKRWLIIAIVCMVVFASIIGIFLFVIPPTLFSDSSTVVSGGTLHLHGRNFFPGSNVILTLDNGLPVSYTDSNATDEVQHQTSTGTDLATASQMMVAGQFMQTTTSNTAVPVSGTGTFDANIAVSAAWPLGMHTIHATGGFISRSAALDFTVVKLAKLMIQTSTLDFGKPEKGIKAILPIEIDNTGGQSLNWTATAGSTAWLKLSSSTGSIEPGHFQLIYVTADTGQLALKAYTATITINSNGGNGVVGVKLSVQPKNSHPQARLNVNPSSLNFGTLGANTQTTLVVAVGNVGDRALSWKANIAIATWLTINTSQGTVQPGGLPQQIQVTANTSQLAAGSYSASLSINSNGGNTTLQVTLAVNTLPTPTPTSKLSTPTPLPTLTSTPLPTPTPTNPPPPPTPTPTNPPPPPTPTPSATPPTDNLTLSFTDSVGVTTTNSYSGQVIITVSGTGNAASTTPNSSDAFYIFLDPSGNPVSPPIHKSCWALEMYLNNQWTENFVSPTPLYESSHSYTFTMSAPGGQLSFKICDGIYSDNGGYLNITVTGSASSSSLAEVSSISTIQVGASSTDMLSEENKKNWSHLGNVRVQ